MFDSLLLEAFMREFYGYGSYCAKAWFVGMEEGGGDDLQEIQRRLTAWDTRGRRELEDLPAYHTDIKITRHIGPNARLQTTWSRLVRVFLASERLAPTRESVRAYQGARFGTSPGDTCVVELLPLPSPDAEHWHNYSDHSALPYLRTRGEYEEHVRSARIEHLQQRLSDHTPRFVVFYGSGKEQMERWELLSGARFEPTPLDATFISKPGAVLLVAMKHPAEPTGIPNKYFDQVGLLISRACETAGVPRT
jgi:hypothetical protein